MLYREGLEGVSWQVPSLFNNDLAALTFLEVFSEVYGTPPNIKGAYGSPRCIWGSGRNSIYPFDAGVFEETVRCYNGFGVSCYLTFSAYHIDEQQLEDSDGNEMLRILNGTGYRNYAIVSSDLLYDHIRRNYRNLSMEASVLKPVYDFVDYGEQPDYYNNLADRFDKVVLRPEHLLDPDFLHYLDPLKRDRFVAMVNQACRPYCPLASKHYDMYEAYERGWSYPKTSFCGRDESQYMESLIVEYPGQRNLVESGITEFKLQGRNIDPDDFLHMLAEYVFEPTGDIQMLLNFTKVRMRR